MIEAWEARLAGDVSDAEQRFAAARDLAAVRGFRYLRASQVADLPHDDLLQRIEAVPVRDGEPDMIEAAAVLGTVPKPAITVSRALEIFWAITGDRILGKSDDQLRRWKNPRINAVRNFISPS